MSSIDQNIEKWKQRPLGHKIFTFTAFALLSYFAFNFVLIPVFDAGDAIRYSRAADWRIGEDVRQTILKRFPDLPLQSLTMSLKPQDLRKGYSISSPGTASFYAPKSNNCYQLKYSCEYSSQWKSGIWGRLQFKPSKILVGECKKIEVEIPF